MPRLFEAGPQPHPTPAVPAGGGKEKKTVVEHEMQATRRNCVKASSCVLILFNLTEMVYFSLKGVTGLTPEVTWVVDGV